MYNLTLENDNGLQLEFNQVGGPYTIVQIEGLDPADATINTNTTALLDGATFNSSKVQMRSLNIAFVIEQNVEANRLAMYKVIQPKKPITIYYKSDLMDVFINGYVESLKVGHFDQKQMVTTSIICPFPYWKNAQEVINELSATISMFHFPFASEGGKNLLQTTEESQSVGGINFTVNADGSINANGTANDYTWSAYVTQSLTLVPGNYILNGCPSNGSSSTYRLQAFTGSPSAPTLTVNDYGSGASFTLTEQSTVLVRMLIKGTVNNLTFYPMIRYATIDNDTWQPYDFGEIVFGAIDYTTNAIIDNNGTVDTGLTFELYARGTIVNPKIFNYITQEFIGINFTFQAGDLVTINTQKGQKSITLLRGGIESNLFNSVMKNVTWLQLPSGGAAFVYTVESGLISNLSVTIKHYDLFEGV